MHNLKLFVLVATLLTALPFITHAQPNDAFLRQFKANPKVAINLTPTKIGSQDPILLQDKIRACRRDESRQIIMRTSQQLSRKRYWEKKSRENKLREWTDAKAEAQDFLELPNDQIVDQLNKMHGSLQSAQLNMRPWSSDYWPIRTGALARRYLDKNFPNSVENNTWLQGYEYFELNPPWLLSDKSLFSPAEKYDNFVNDNAWTMTLANWQEGRAYHERYGDVEKWMGLCHGWAPASFMEPRPTKTIKVKSLGTQEEITFLPDDVKALATLKWANGVSLTEDLKRSGTRFIGGRCNEKSPQKDPETGRMIDPQCFDLNPGLWHTVIVNQIANEKRPFVIDAAFDYEVWNQPVISYGYEYFNPKTGDIVEELDAARVRLDDPEFKDTFKKFRNGSEATSVVGIKMWVKYMVETSPTGREVDHEKYDRAMSSVYYYDLELDENDHILGGEWYQNQHPDFIWMPVKNSVVLNREDLAVKNAADALHMAPDASRAMAPLRFVLDQLFDALRE